MGMYYVFLAATPKIAGAIAESVQAMIHEEAERRGDGGLPCKGCNRYSEVLVHPTLGQAAIPALAGGIPTEEYRKRGVFVSAPPVPFDTTTFQDS